jgi:rubredoxin
MSESENPSPEPWALLPSEVVCPTCRLAHHKHLPECPVCKELAR